MFTLKGVQYLNKKLHDIALFLAIKTFFELMLLLLWRPVERHPLLYCRQEFGRQERKLISERLIVPYSLCDVILTNPVRRKSLSFLISILGKRLHNQNKFNPWKVDDTIRLKKRTFLTADIFSTHIIRAVELRHLNVIHPSLINVINTNYVWQVRMSVV